MNPLFPEIPEDFAALSTEELNAFVAAVAEKIGEISADAQAFVTDELPAKDLIASMKSAVTALEAARTELATREDEPEEPEEIEEVEEPEPELSAEVAELAARAAEPLAEATILVTPDLSSFSEKLEAGINAAVENALAKFTSEAEAEPELEPETTPAEPEEAITAAAPAPGKPKLPTPGRSRQAAPSTPPVQLTAAAGGLGFDIGDTIPGELDYADMITRRRSQFGRIPDGTVGEKVTLARLDWRDRYPSDRIVTRSESDMQLVASVTDPEKIKAEMKRRRNGSLTASGGLCAPVTPYYNLAMISQASRPVRAALPAFNADRGGIKYARPAALSAVDDAIGIRTAEEDGLGGTFATKSCQVVPCPEFVETDVAILYHCLQFGNLGARTFPERVAQWNSLTLAAHARLAESFLLTGIDDFSTQVTAGSLGLGATSDLFPQILAAANGMRNRHRMDPEAVLRLMIPDWAIDLLVSDVIRSQFQRFDTDEARVVALLRTFDIEPTFYIDGASGRGQVFGAQPGGALLTFPKEVVWYLYPEGSFLYVDGGVLELGLVRDSVLNSTNDFQLFGESFENVAFTGVESLAVVSEVCDSGVVAAPDAVTCGYTYEGTT